MNMSKRPSIFYRDIHMEPLQMFRLKRLTVPCGKFEPNSAHAFWGNSLSLATRLTKDNFS